VRLALRHAVVEHRALDRPAHRRLAADGGGLQPVVAHGEESAVDE
jgi:hypothetical protein